MKKRCALIVTDDKEFSAWEIFSFYHLKQKKEGRLYGKMLEFVPTDEVTFYIFHAPIPKKVNIKFCNYLAQYIKKLSAFLNISVVYYSWNSINGAQLSEYFNKHQNKISCVSLYSKSDIIKKYVKTARIPFQDVTAVILCEFPHQVYEAIKEICLDIRQIYIYTKAIHSFSEMIQYFFSEYGILLNVGDTLEGVPNERSIVLSFCREKAFVENFILHQNKPVLNVTSEKLGISGVYEDVLVSGNREINQIAAKCGEFNSSVLSFLFSAYESEQTNTAFGRFTNKFDIKTIKFVKND